MSCPIDGQKKSVCTMRYSIALAVFLSSSNAFSLSWTSSRFSSSIDSPSQHCRSDQLTTLFAKKRKGNANAKLAALEALEALEEKVNVPLSLKEQKALAKKQAKAEKNGASEQDANDAEPDAAPKKQLSRKEQMLMKALELEKLDADKSLAQEEVSEPQLSKKELKALRKKEEKQAAKAAAKAEKKTARESSSAETEIVSSGETSGEPIPNPAEKKKLTLEDKIRKDRPPPRIRVMESSQPGFVSLRLENVGITFRNQEVLKDVTWGVQSGDRIGLVGKNGAGKVRKYIGLHLKCCALLMHMPSTSRFFAIHICPRMPDESQRLLNCVFCREN